VTKFVANLPKIVIWLVDGELRGTQKIGLITLIIPRQGRRSLLPLHAALMVKEFSPKSYKRVVQ
jgi:hypothetical protein